jgi:hypothetical protein
MKMLSPNSNKIRLMKEYEVNAGALDRPANITHVGGSTEKQVIGIGFEPRVHHTIVTDRSF